MGGDWIDTKLGDVLTLKRGYDLPTQDRRPGPFPVVSSSGVTGSHDEAKVKAPGVVTGRYGTLGEVHFITQDYWPLNTTLYVKDFKRNDPRFISYFLKGLNFASYNDKSSVPGLNRNHLHTEIVHFPADGAEQRAIASILGAFDDKIELNRQMNHTLETMARAIFKAWFVDFEPVKAKVAGATSFRGMPHEVFDQLPARMTESEFGPVPEGWEVKRLDELMVINPKRILKKGDIAPYLPMSEMPTRGHAPENWETRALGSGVRFTNGDTLVARITPCLENGKTAFVDFLPEGITGWGSTEYIVIRPKEPLPDIYAYCLARSSAFRDFAIKNMTGTSGRQRVPASAIGGFKIVEPCARLAHEFGNVVGPLFAMASGNLGQSRTLASIRDTLLPKFISGEIRVPKAMQSSSVKCSLP